MILILCNRWPLSKEQWQGRAQFPTISSRAVGLASVFTSTKIESDTVEFHAINSSTVTYGEKEKDTMGY